MIRVWVVAPDRIVRAGLESIIRTSPDLIVVNATANFDTLSVIEDDPDVLLLGVDNDSQLPLNAIAEIPTVLLTDVLSDLSSDVLHLGVRAILPRSATPEEIVATVTAVSTGLIVLNPETLDFLLSLLPSSNRTPPTSPMQALTAREIEVLTMLAEGWSNKAIARHLHISEHTVKFHVSSIFTKLNVSSRTEAVTIGARQGLIML